MALDRRILLRPLRPPAVEGGKWHPHLYMSSGEGLVAEMPPSGSTTKFYGWRPGFT
ncbi:MAG: hypothetical protein ACOC8R_01295 [Desulfosalsimonas sp.]